MRTSSARGRLFNFKNDGAYHLHIFLAAPISSGLVITDPTRLVNIKRCLTAFTIQDNELEQLVSQAWETGV